LEEKSDKAYDMEVNNSKNVTRTKTALISVPFMLLLGTAVLAIFRMIDTWMLTLISGVLVLVGWSLTIVLKLKAVKFRYQDDKIALLYYPVSPLTANFKKIEIAAGQFVKYEIRTRWLGLKKDLILYETKAGEEACYPPVSITIFGKENLRQVKEILDSLCR